MFKFNSLYINFVSVVLSIIIFVTGNFIFENHEKISKNSTVETYSNSILDENNLNIKDWYLEIPKIELKAPIWEGTEGEVLNKYIGHFVETSRKNGTVGLART